jgi:hypothetical protein
MFSLSKCLPACGEHGKADGSASRGIKTCGRPIWAQGLPQGRRVRQSTGCTSFKAAEELVKWREEEGSTQTRSACQEIPFTIQRFLDDARARGIDEHQEVPQPAAKPSPRIAAEMQGRASAYIWHLVLSF